jgi:glycerate dehydrogenase
MRIVVLDGYTLNPGDNPWDPIRPLGELVVHDHTAESDVVARAAGAEIVLTNKTPISAAAIEALPQLRFISVLATGYNIVDTAAAAKRGIAVSNVPIYGTDSVAQFVMALLLEMVQHVGLHDSAVKAGEWTRGRDFCFWKTPLIELAGKTMGIVGFGRIGRRVGELAAAFGMKVIANTPHPKNPPAYAGFDWKSIDEIFAQSDFISLHCPLTADNREFVNAALLSKMKKSAMLINTARGLLINEADLAAALNSGQLAGAAVDVVSAEPIKAENPLLNAKNLIITPHIAWATHAARQRIMQMTADNIRAFQNGKPVNVVNTSLLKPA